MSDGIGEKFLILMTMDYGSEKFEVSMVCFTDKRIRGFDIFMLQGIKRRIIPIMNKNTDIGTRYNVELRIVVLCRGKMIDDFLLNAKRSVTEEKIKKLMLKKSDLNR